MVTTTPHLDIPMLVASQGSPRTRHNEALARLDFLAAPYVKESRTSPPASPTDGHAYIVIATATGVWAGQEDTIAVAHNSGTEWLHIPLYAGLRVMHGQEDATTPKNEERVYLDSTVGFIPCRKRLADVDSAVAAEHAIGYLNGRVRYAKSFDFGACPNATFVDVAHGISSLELGDAWWPRYEIAMTNGSSAFSGDTTLTTGVIQHASWTATNFTLTGNTNLSSYSAHVYVEYCKTS